MTSLGQSHSQVDRHGGLAHTAFAAGNADDFGGFVVTHG
jgi:hypothetical protein